MKSPNKYTIDTIEGNIAVLLRQDNENIRKEVATDSLPSNIKDGDIVQEIIDGEKTTYNILESETEQRRKNATDLLNKLKNK